MSDTEVPLVKRKTIAYVDGFNLYYGILKENPSWKWLDLVAFLSSLRPDEQIVGVRYFTALIDADRHESRARDRQKTYINALASNPAVSVHYGNYQLRDVKCEAACKQGYKIPKEKKTDVGMAVAMMSDAIDGRMDTIVLVSGDSDLEPAVEWIRQRYPVLKIVVYVPAAPATSGPSRRSDGYKNMQVAVKALPTADILKCQFEKIVRLGAGRISGRPPEWR